MKEVPKDIAVEVRLVQKLLLNRVRHFSSVKNQRASKKDAPHDEIAHQHEDGKSISISNLLSRAFLICLIIFFLGMIVTIYLRVFQSINDTSSLTQAEESTFEYCDVFSICSNEKSTFDGFP